MGSDAADYRAASYNYDLPVAMIAQHPVVPRDSARLLVLDRARDTIEHRVFRDIGKYLKRGDLLVLNDTRVIPARTYGTRHTGGKVEVFFLRETAPGRCEVMIRCGGSPRPGEFIQLEGGALSVRLLEQRPGGIWLASLPRGSSLHDVLDAVGRMPLPPYIRRDRNEPPDPADREYYQTVYASDPGAVAAPTAGLHFTEDLLNDLEGRGIKIARITLHVGAGTFRPIKDNDIRQHRIHEEWFAIGEEAARKISQTRKSDGRIVAVGTTSCRSLEAAALRPEGFGSLESETDLYIVPPFAFKMTDVLLTNFHLPRSTLLVLVAAFAGRERVLAAYEKAKREGYRFYSYGDAMLIL